MYRQYAYPVARCGGIGSLLAALCAIGLKSTSSTYIGETTPLGTFEAMGTALASLPFGFVFGVLAAVTVNTGFLMRAPIESEEPALGGYMIRGYGYMDRSMLFFRVWMRWVVLTSVGWYMGILAGNLLSALVGQKFLLPMSVGPLNVNPISGLWMGLAVSLAQKVAVRPWMRLSRRWVWRAVIAIGGPFALIGFLHCAPEIWLIPGVTAGGALCGLLQVPALRPHVSRVYWWVFASTVSWGLAWFILRVSGPAGLILSPLVLGGIAGLFFIGLRRPPNIAQKSSNLVAGIVEESS